MINPNRFSQAGSLIGVVKGQARLRTKIAISLLAAASLACVTLGGAPAAPTLPVPVQWRQTLPQGIQLVSPPALADGLLVYVEDAKTVVVRDAATGAQKWRHVLGQSSDLTRPMAAVGSRVFINETYVDGAGAAGARVLALGLHTGQTGWELSASSAVTSTFSAPLAGGGLLYFQAPAAPGNALLDAVEPDSGALRWQLPLTGTVLVSEPLIDNGLLFITKDHPTATDQPYAQDLLALDAATGALRWSVPLGARTQPILAAGLGRVYAPTEDGWFWALDETSGAVVWKVHFRNGSPYNFNTSPVRLAGNALYFSDTESDLFALDAATGGQLWKVPLDAYGSQRPAESSGRLYLGLGNGLLVAIDAKNGNTLWTTRNPYHQSWPSGFTPPLNTQPVAGVGVLYYFNGSELVALSIP